MRKLIFPILIGVFAYLGWSLLAPFHTALAWGTGVVALAALLAVILWVPLVHWREDRESSSDGERYILWIAFGGMGMVSFILVLSIVRDLVSLLFRVPLRTPEGTEIVLLLAVLFFFYGVFNATLRVHVKRVAVALPGLPEALRGLKIVQISDLHVGPTIRRAFVNRVVERANACAPDLVVLTGDLVDGMVGDLRGEVAPLAGMQARLGKFYIPGNHEYYWEPLPWIRKFEELGFTPLLNEHRLVAVGSARLVLAGVPDFTGPSMNMPGPDPVAALQGVPADAFPKILLCHQPHLAEAAEKAGFDLQLSGHTHGGQFFPWTWFAGRVHRHQNQGLSRSGRMALYVSRGTGYWGPPVRLGAPAEITLLVLESTQE